MRTRVRIVAVLALVGFALVAGCGRKLVSLVSIGNQPPTVRMTVERPQPLERTRVSRDVSWTATDLDGRVDHYLVSLNPASVDRVDESWHAVLETRRAVVARLSASAALEANPQPKQLQVVSVRAVDDQGAASAPSYLAFWNENVAPSVKITSPNPSSLTIAYLPSTFRITWAGFDPDGPNPNHLEKYKYRLIPEGDPDYDLILSPHGGPDSLIRRSAPGFATWDSLPGDSLGHTFRGLAHEQQLVFVITGFDAAGDYDPILSFYKNVLRIRVSAVDVGPRLTFTNPWFQYTFIRPSAEPDSFNVVGMDALADQPVPMLWIGTAQLGAQVASYRWAVDIQDIHDETPRHGRHDLDHWSAWSATATSATIPAPRGPHTSPTRQLYVEASDNVGFVSLAIVRIQYFRPEPNRDLLIVNDTRLTPDMMMRTKRDLRLPSGAWPTAAELDTFLFARGGMPWLGYIGKYFSSPGILAGYDYDTLGTRGALTNDPVPISVLSQYRHVVWMVDADGAGYTGGGAFNPMTALRLMTQPNHENVLALYIMSGGQVWLLGGGAGLAATANLDNPTNGKGTFSDLELKPGVFMYDYPHWRSGFTGFSTGAELMRTAGGAAVPGLPPGLDRRTPATDPLPPLRSVQEFYFSTVHVEYINAPNSILENPREKGDRSAFVPVLDTLYSAASDASRPCMTIYRGGDNAPVIFSGFDLWSFTRSQCVQIVDAVLQQRWGLTRSATVAATANEVNRRQRPLARPR